jgi:hypothetical protein
MLSFVSPLASQIGFLIASLNKSNYKSLALELSQVNLNLLQSGAIAQTVQFLFLPHWNVCCIWLHKQKDDSNVCS